MAAPASPINPLTQSVGFNIRRVRVTQVDATQGIALAVDDMNVQVTLPLFVTRAAARPPLPGETWIIDQSLGFWTFAALISTSAVSSVATTLDDLSNVSVPTPSNGQILRYNSATTLWEAVTTPGPNPWVWNITDGANDGLTINGTSGTLKQIFLIKDYLGAPIFGVGHVGGAAVYGDHLRVFAPGVGFVNTFDVDPDGKVTISGTGQLQLGATVLTETDIQDLHSHSGTNPWLFIQTDIAQDGMIVRGAGGSLNTIFGVEDGGSNLIMNVSPLGGVGVFGNQFRVFTGVFGSATIVLDPAGTITVTGTGTLTLGAQTLTAADITALHGVSTTYIPNTAKAAASGVASLDSSSHLVQLPALPSLSVYRSAALSLTTTSLTVLGWDAEDHQDNVSANAMHNTASNNSRLIAPIAGKYDVRATVQVASNAAAPYLTIQVRLNGTTVLRARATNGVASQVNSVDIAARLKLSANDYVEVLVSSTVSGQALTVGSSTCFASLTFATA
jgi:hypothetical protein